MEVLITPIIAAIVGLAVWFIQSRVEAVRQAEARIRDERRKIYADLLAPFIEMLSTTDDTRRPHKRHDPTALRKAAFEVSLIGSDNVVRAYNKMMQTFFRADKEERDIPSKETLQLWGDLLLQIRISVGEPPTKLGPRDMLRGIINDIDDIPSRFFVLMNFTTRREAPCPTPSEL